MEKVKQKALTFDDVLLLPRYSDFVPSEASTQTNMYAQAAALSESDIKELSKYIVTL